MKKVLCTIIAMVMIVSMFGGVLLAERTDTTILYRGGGSKRFSIQTKTTVGSWRANLTYVHAFGGGTPGGLIASNGFYTRMRTNGGVAASPTIYHNYNNYQTVAWQNYSSGYGGIDQDYRMYTSMASSSGHPSASVTFVWNP